MRNLPEMVLRLLAAMRETLTMPAQFRRTESGGLEVAQNEIWIHVPAAAADELDRLRNGLRKIADRYPCNNPETMSRVAKDALGE